MSKCESVNRGGNKTSELLCNRSLQLSPPCMHPHRPIEMYPCGPSKYRTIYSGRGVAMVASLSLPAHQSIGQSILAGAVAMVASLSLPGGKDRTFPQYFLIFPHIFFIFFLVLAPRKALTTPMYFGAKMSEKSWVNDWLFIDSTLFTKNTFLPYMP